MEREYESCRLCPRACGVDRNSGNAGFCGETSILRLAWAGLHFGEEPPVTGAGGSGAIFVTGCNLGCTFCQNFQISRDGTGRAVDSGEFAQICLRLEEAGAENINIVTGSHAIPAIAGGLRAARAAGLTIPILWNSSAYETVEALSLLEGLVDVWLPDLKTLNPELSAAVFRAPDYPQTAKRAIRYMAGISPIGMAPDSGASRKILSGVIVRHLALPGRIADTEAVLRWYSEHLADRTLLSLMTQYTPVVQSPYSRDIAEFENRQIDRSEYRRLKTLLEELGIDSGFYQELVEDTEWLPDFTNTQPFSSALAKPVWHWTTGFVYQQN